MTNLIKLTLPPSEIYFPFHLDSLFLIFATIPYHNSFLLWFPPTNIPRYVNDKVMIQFKTASNLYIS